MSAMRSLDLQCDDCSYWVCGNQRWRNMRSLRAAYRNDGWTIYRKDGRLRDRCPECSEKAKPAKKRRAGK